jgi:hypothetical protein
VWLPDRLEAILPSDTIGIIIPRKPEGQGQTPMTLPYLGSVSEVSFLNRMYSSQRDGPILR